MRVSTLFLLAGLLGCSSSPIRPESEPAAPLDPAYAAKAVALSLECAVQEKPHYYDRICEGCLTSPRQKHPAFYGCFDWHSSVHGHWAMLHVLHQQPDFPRKNEVLKILNTHFQKKKMAAELDFFLKKPSFEIPYGYGWYLRLVTEVESSSLPEAAPWREALKPLALHMARKLEAYLEKMNLPMREGAHLNTAFALAHAWDYAVSAKDLSLQKSISAKAREFFGADINCPLAYEPSSGDFISPCFAEADLMRRVLPPKEFSRWFDRFLPRLDAKLLQPISPLDPKDYILGHLIGLMYQKAAAMKGVASVLSASDPRRSTLEAAAQAQAATGWTLMFDSGYGGTHWLASFAIFHYGNVGLKNQEMKK